MNTYSNGLALKGLLTMKDFVNELNLTQKMLYKIILMIKTLLAKKVETSVIRIFKINHFKNHL